jgi:hypothetical protein
VIKLGEWSTHKVCTTLTVDHAGGFRQEAAMFKQGVLTEDRATDGGYMDYHGEDGDAPSQTHDPTQIKVGDPLVQLFVDGVVGTVNFLVEVLAD